MPKNTQNKVLKKSRAPKFKNGSKSNISVVMDCPESLSRSAEMNFLMNIATTARAYRILLLISDEPKIKGRQKNVISLISQSIGSTLKTNVLALSTDEALSHIAEKEYSSNAEVHTYWFASNYLQLVPENASRVASTMRNNLLFMGLGSTSIISAHLVKLARSKPMYRSVSKRQIRECWGSLPHQSPILSSEVFLTSSAAHTALKNYRSVSSINVPAIMNMMSLSNIAIADSHTAVRTDVAGLIGSKSLVAA